MKSILTPVTKQDVLEVYARFSEAEHEYQKAMWESELAMINRSDLPCRLVDWARVKSWMDVGCGTGTLFERVDLLGVKIPHAVGIDISNDMLRFAREKKFQTLQPEWILADFEGLAGMPEQVDLITLMGVLQICGIHQEKALGIVANLLAPGGQFYMTTVSADWKDIQDGTFELPPKFSAFSSKELVQILDACGIEVFQMSGFLAEENKFVDVTENHSFFIYGRKRG